MDQKLVTKIIDLAIKGFQNKDRSDKIDIFKTLQVLKKIDYQVYKIDFILSEKIILTLAQLYLKNINSVTKECNNLNKKLLFEMALSHIKPVKKTKQRKPYQKIEIVRAQSTLQEAVNLSSQFTVLDNERVRSRSQDVHPYQDFHYVPVLPQTQVTKEPVIQQVEDSQSQQNPKRMFLFLKQQENQDPLLPFYQHQLQQMQMEKVPYFEPPAIEQQQITPKTTQSTLAHRKQFSQFLDQRKRINNQMKTMRRREREVSKIKRGFKKNDKSTIRITKNENYELLSTDIIDQNIRLDKNKSSIKQSIIVDLQKGEEIKIKVDGETERVRQYMNNFKSIDLSTLLNSKQNPNIQILKQIQPIKIHLDPNLIEKFSRQKIVKDEQLHQQTQFVGELNHIQFPLEQQSINPFQQLDEDVNHKIEQNEQLDQNNFEQQPQSNEGKVQMPNQVDKSMYLKLFMLVQQMDSGSQKKCLNFNQYLEDMKYDKMTRIDLFMYLVKQHQLSISQQNPAQYSDINVWRKRPDQNLLA